MASPFTPPRSPLSTLKSQLKRQDAKQSGLMNISKPSVQRIDRTTTRKKLI